jgi:hypothetical protein
MRVERCYAGGYREVEQQVRVRYYDSDINSNVRGFIPVGVWSMRAEKSGSMLLLTFRKFVSPPATNASGEEEVTCLSLAGCSSQALA